MTIVREAAWRILRAKGDTTLRKVASTAKRLELDAKERALLRAIVGVEVRRRASLRALVRTFARGNPPRDVVHFLHVGLAQLFFLDRVHDHVALRTTIDAVRDQLGDKKARYVQGVLHAALRVRREGASDDPRRNLPLVARHVECDLFHDPAVHPILWTEDALNLPAPLAKRWLKRLGEERTRELALDALRESDLSIRVARGERTALIEELAPLVAPRELRHGLHEQIILAPASAAHALVHSAAFREGRVTVQGESALRAAELLDARAGERVLELCAAPGGKTAVLARNGASILAVDDDAGRIERCQETLARLVPDASIELRVADGAVGLDDASFDAAFVDVPCSNTGVLAARPAARWRFSTAAQDELGLLQTRLLSHAARCVRSRGRLVYSTCSVEPQENQRRVRAFVEEHASWSVAREIESMPAPHGPEGPIDGGYAALLVRA